MKTGDTVHVVRTTRRRAYYEGTATLGVVFHTWRARGGLCFDCMVTFADGCTERRRVYDALQDDPKGWISKYNSGDSRVSSTAA